MKLICMFLLIYIINNIIRILCAYGMFCSFSNGYYFLSAILFIGALKRDWLIVDTMGYGNKVQIGIDNHHRMEKH